MGLCGSAPEGGREVSLELGPRRRFWRMGRKADLTFVPNRRTRAQMHPTLTQGLDRLARINSAVTRLPHSWPSR